MRSLAIAFVCCCGLWIGLFFGLLYPEIIINTGFEGANCTILATAKVNYTSCFKECHKDHCISCNLNDPTCDSLLEEQLNGTCCDGPYCCGECCQTCLKCKEICINSNGMESCYQQCGGYKCNCNCCHKTPNIACKVNCLNGWKVELQVSYSCSDRSSCCPCGMNNSISQHFTQLIKDCGIDESCANNYLNNFQPNQTTPCWYDEENCDSLLFQRGYTWWKWLLWGFPSLVILVSLNLVTCVACRSCCQKWNYYISAYIFGWWVLLFPLGFLLPLQLATGNTISSESKFVIFLVMISLICVGMGTTVCVYRKCKIKAKTILPAFFWTLAPGTCFPMVHFWNEFGWIFVGVCIFLVLCGLCTCLLRTSHFKRAATKTKKKIKATIHAHIITSKEMTSLVHVERTALIRDMKLIIDNPEFSDLVISVEQKPIHIHKIILHVRCPKFLKYLERHKRPPENYSYSVIIHFLELAYSSQTENVECAEQGTLKEAFERLRRDFLIDWLSLVTYVNTGKTLYLQHPPSELFKDFKRCLYNQAYSDVSFESGGVDILNVHKIFLSTRSAFLKALVSDIWAGGTPGGKIAIKFHPKVFKAILSYIYTSNVEDNTLDGETVLATMEEANLLGLPELTQICELYIAARISLYNVTELYQFSLGIGAVQLQHVCEYYCERKGIPLKPTVSETEPLLS